ncbi:hypothetical protein [Serratia marcescens]|uniref:hypothetical protein n=1 Tax=Serratia marcescens TaxID=615 RepID=UPI0034E26441
MTLTTEQFNDFAGVFRKDAARWVESGEPEIALELHALADELDALAANREAQPVALVDRRKAASGSICWQNGGKDLPHGTELFTAPPADAALFGVSIALREWIDAVPREVAASLPKMPGVDRDWVDSIIGEVAQKLATPLKVGLTVECDFCSACNERYCGNCAHANGAKVQ